jgi:hypothetical protein
MLRPLLAATLALATSGGCLRRVEMIEVHPDGSATLMARFEGDPEDVQTGDALPREQSGWRVTCVEKQEGDKPKVMIDATRRIAAGAEIPATYAVDGEPAHALTFPTTITVEQRPNGTYYHFRRVYRARRWARYDFAPSDATNREEIEKVLKNDPKEITDEERAMLAASLVRAERAKTLAYLDTGLERLRDAIRQDTRLAVRAGVAEVFAADWLQKRARALLTHDEQSEETRLTLARVDAAVMAALDASAGRQGLTDAMTARIRDAFLDARAEHAISRDLEDEAWGVGVQLPGRIIADNGNDEHARPTAPDSDEPVAPFTPDGSEDGFPRGPGRCGWYFEGEALYDRDVVLMATSFVPRQP